MWETRKKFKIRCKTCDKEREVGYDQKRNIEKYQNFGNCYKCAAKIRKSPNVFKKGFTPWNKGGHHSKETIQKFSEMRRGIKRKPRTKEHQEKLSSALRGKKRPQEVKDKITKKLLGQNRGEKHHNWKGGITPIALHIRQSFKYKYWRNEIFKRDKFTCKICHQIGKELEVDHYPKLFSEIFREYNPKTVEEAETCTDFWDLDNGRTLCKACHKKYGRRK